MPRRIAGDPLTGSLPRTQLVVPQDIFGPVRQPRRTIVDRDKESWPRVADPMAVTFQQMIPGRVAFVRTRWGIRRWQIRTVNRSREMRNKGRHFFVGMDRRGFCHSAWVESVVSVESVQRALTAARALKALPRAQ
jgi:hypothetical protein